MTEVVDGAGIALGVRLAGSVLAFAFHALLARRLGSQGTGIFFLALSILMAASVFGKMGLDIALLRFTAETAAVGDGAALRATYRRILNLTLAAATFSTGALFALAPYLATTVFDEPDLCGPLRWISLAVLPTCLLQIHVEGLRGLRRILYSQALAAVVVPVVSILAFLILTTPQGVLAAVWARSLAALIGALLSIYVWRRVGLGGAASCFGGASYLEILASSRPVAVLHLSTLVTLRLPLVALGFWWMAEDVGVFGIAQRTVLLLSFGLGAVNSIIAPKFAALHREGRQLELAQMARRTTLLLMVLALPVASMIIFFSNDILALFGEDFSGKGKILVILTLGQLVNVATGPAGYLLIMTGHEKDAGRVGIWTAVLAAVLVLVLVPKGGAVGAAIVASVTVVFSNLVYVFLVQRRLGISLTRLIPKREKAGHS